MPINSSFDALLTEVRACRICEAFLPLGPRPVLQASAHARLLIAGQAPGLKVHQSDIPFQDASGDRLRTWLGISYENFYNRDLVAVLPMGFCYPGTGKQGDLPPRKECAPAWRSQLLAGMQELQLTLVIGAYAQAYHLPEQYPSLTDAVKAWRDHWPSIVPLPHPSPRNNRWLKRNEWFELELLPVLRERVASILKNT